MLVNIMFLRMAEIARTYLIFVAAILSDHYSCTAALNIGRFWHVTDLHYDDRYSINGDPDLMCWEISGNEKNDTVGKYGDHRCDSPKALIESAVSAMKTILPDPDFILWTGDDTTHVNDSFFSTDIVYNVIANCTYFLDQAFPDTVVLPVMGNHDLYPQNQIAPGESELQTRVADLWKKWLDKYDAYLDFKQYGRYVAHLFDFQVSVVALNTLLWYESNEITKNDANATDPAGQFSWVNNVLKSLGGIGIKVYLVGHIPPGMFERYFDKQEGFHWYQPRYNQQYINLVNNHSDTIAAQFFGHHHTDSFRVFVSKDGSVTPLSYALIAPGVTPIRSTLSPEAGANNPGIRLITYDRDTGEVLESTTYYLDLEKANAENTDDWLFEYNLTSLLNLAEINAQTLFEAQQKLEEDRDFFNQYYPVNTVQWDDASNCSEQCHLTQLCSMTNIDYNDYYYCNGSWKPVYMSLLIAVVFTFLIFQKLANRLI